ncbi:MAG: hypothetical protein MUF00_05700 [Gemmatimonadaceae bacterium]|jgi:hypothetical protein|nr:hypothetical protein [Gemmatimonadaceae bacterium]
MPRTILRRLPHSRLLCVTLLAALTGCYRVAPVELSALPVGAQATFDLSGSAVERLRRDPTQALLLDDFSVSGRLAARDGDSLRVTVPTRISEGTAPPTTVFRDLRLGADEVRRVQQRTLDRRRTTITATALGAATVVASTFIVYRGGRASGNSGRPVDPTDLRIPIVVFR